MFTPAVLELLHKQTRTEMRLFPTWTVDEGPVVFGLAGTHAGIERRMRAGRQAGQGGRGRDGGLEGPAIRALDALAFARVAGVGAPAAARLLQALPARPVPGAVLSCSETEHSPGNLCRSVRLSTTAPALTRITHHVISAGGIMGVVVQ